MPRSPDSVRRVGQDDDDDDISSHGSMPPLEPLRTSRGSPSTSIAGGRNQNDGNDEDDSDDLSMPSLEDIRPDRSSQLHRTETVGGTRRDEQADDLIGMIARAIADEFLKKNDTDDSDNEGGNDDDDDDDDSSSMPPLEDIATNDKKQGNKRGRDGTDIKSKTDKPSPASLSLKGGKTTSAATTGAAPFKFNLGASNASSNPSPFTFATGPLASSASSAKNNNDDAPIPFTFSTKPPSNGKTAGEGDTTGKKKGDTSKNSTFMFSPTSVATPSSAASSPPSVGKSLAFQFNAASGSNGSASAPSPKPFFSTQSKDPSLQAAAKAAANTAASANNGSSSIFGPAPSSMVASRVSGGASVQRRKKKRDAAGSRARSSPPSPKLGSNPSPPTPFQFGPAAGKAQSTTLKAAVDSDMEKKPAAVPSALAQSRNASAAAAIERAAERAADDIFSTGRSTRMAVASAMSAEGVAIANGSLSPMFRNNGAPRRIVRGRRPPNASSEGPSARTNATSAASVTAGNSATPSNTSAGRNNSVTTTTAASAPVSAATSLAVATPEMHGENTETLPRAVIQADESNENMNARNREVSDDADSESEEEANITNANTFGALAEDSEDSDEVDDHDDAEDSDEITVDDNDDDSNSEDFPLRLLEDLLPPGVGSRVAARLMNGSGPGSRQQLSTNIKPDDDDSVASSDDEHGVEAVKCCACYRSSNQNHKWKRLVTLPCCGLDGKEKSSSTRFCASCVLKLAVTRPASASSLGEYHFFEDECNEAPVSRFYKESRQSETKRFIECPRCRDILVVKLKNLKTTWSIDDEEDDSDSDQCDCSECRAERRANRKPAETKTASSISVQRATFKAKAWFVGRKRDNAMILWKAAHLHHSLIPLSALGGDKYRANVMKLVGWGILHKVPGKRNVDIYEMDRRYQTELVKLVSPNPSTETDEEVNKEFDLFLELTHDMGYAGWDAIKKFRIDRTIRLLNRFLYLMMYFRRYLPSPPLSLWQEWSVTALNAFNLALVSQFLLITAVYGGLFFGVSIVVCRALRNPEKFRSSRWMYLSALFGAYLAYRFGKLVYFSPYITFLGFLSPKAIIPFKKIVWG